MIKWVQETCLKSQNKTKQYKLRVTLLGDMSRAGCACLKAWSVCTRVRTCEIFSEHSTTLSNSEDVSMWLKQKISTSWIPYCSKILRLFKSAQTNVKDAFLCFEFSVMDERNRNNPDMLRELSDTEVLYCERIEHCFVNIVALIILKLFLNLMRKLLYTLAPSRHVDVHRCASHLPFCKRFIFLNSNKAIAYPS